MKERGEYRRITWDFKCECWKTFMVCNLCVDDPKTWTPSGDFDTDLDWAKVNKQPIILVSYGKCMKCVELSRSKML